MICRTCSAPVLLRDITLRDGTTRTVPMDPTLPVYERVTDPDSEPRATFWVEVGKQDGERWAMGLHRCRRETN